MQSSQFMLRGRATTQYVPNPLGSTQFLSRGFAVFAFNWISAFLRVVRIEPFLEKGIVGEN